MMVSLTIAEAGGEIHKYVGDEVIATWPLAPGANEARCVRACFAAFERLAANSADYDREFGERADFRAGLHCGPVVVGELGYLQKEIALIGDAMNTAARIQQACRETGCDVLASATLLERLSALPPGVTARPLGPLTMRGKERAVELYALETGGRGVRDLPIANPSLQAFRDSEISATARRLDLPSAPSSAFDRRIGEAARLLRAPGSRRVINLAPRP